MPSDPGVDAPSHFLSSLALVFVSALVAGITLTPVPALAARGHVFGYYFGSHVNKTATETAGRESEEDVCPAVGHPSDECQPGEVGSAPGQFDFSTSPPFVAVNEAAGYVYIGDSGNNRIERFSTAGVYEAEIQGSGFGRGIAVDNSCSQHEPPLTGPACESFDPSYGDLYRASADAIEKLSPTGKLLYKITEAPPGHPLGGRSFYGIRGVGIDPTGHVWIYTEESARPYRLFVFANGVENEYTHEVPLDLDYNFGGALTAFAVDANDNLFLGFSHALTEEVREFGPAGEFVRETVGGVQKNVREGQAEGQPPTAVAVESQSNDVYVATPEAVVHVSPENTPVERVGEGRLTRAGGLAIDRSEKAALYVADAGAGRVAVFVGEPANSPLSTAESVRDVGAVAATVEAKLNPRSEPSEAPTTYRFQYGSCPTLAVCASNPYTETSPAATVPPDFELHTVSTELKELKPATDYHFRLVAENGHGRTIGAERTFTTHSASLAFSLPDQRAWELVSPPNKHATLVEGIGGGLAEAGSDGDALTYVARAAIEDEPEGNRLSAAQVLARRTPSGWSTQEIVTPNPAYSGFAPGAEVVEYKLFSSDLSRGLLEPALHSPLLTQEASDWTPYSRDTTLSGSVACPSEPSSCWTPLVTAREPFNDVSPATKFFEGSGEAAFRLQGASPDAARTIISDRLTGSLYEWIASAPWQQRLLTIGVLPVADGGKPVECSTGGRAELANVEDYGMNHAVSVDGSRVFFEVTPIGASGGCAATLQHHLYLRDTATEETLRLDVVQPGGVEETSGPTFQAASADGSVVLLTDSQRLTAASGRGDLYRCQIKTNPSSGRLGCSLTDLTPTGSGNSLGLQGIVLGASSDASRIYFVAQADLTGSQQNEFGEVAVKGEPNLYLSSPGSATTTFIDTLSSADQADWSSDNKKTSRVSSNGRWLEFMSDRPVTEYDNRDTASGERDEEVYLYDASAGAGEANLMCPSCNPTGARPQGELLEQEGALVNAVFHGPWPSRWLAATVPMLTNVTLSTSPYQSRYLSDSGRLFFNAHSSLAPQDTNGTWDVYEWEPAGVGNCSSSSTFYSERSRGCVSLISSGASNQESAFLDASESGNDVFFLTTAQLVGADYDSAYDIYDARVGGGFPETEPPTPCEGGESCGGEGTQALAPSTPASSTLHGKGNVHEGTGPGKVCVAARHRAAALRHQARRLRARARNAHNARSARGRASRLAARARHLVATGCKTKRRQGHARRRRAGHDRRAAR